MIEIETIKSGIGDCPQTNDEVYFFFICHNNQGELISSSQHTATRAVIGRKWLIPEIEQALTKMKQGERSLVKIYHSPATKVCNQNIKEFYDQYEIEIIRIGRKLNKPWHLEGDELYNKAIELKIEGNNGIKQQQYLEAKLIYTEGLNLIKKDYGDREQELQLQLRSNLTLTHLKNKEYEKCIEQANQILQITPENVKLLHRRAVASIETADFDRAKQDLKLAHQLDPKNEEVIKELQGLGEKEKTIKKKQQERAKKMLFGE